MAAGIEGIREPLMDILKALVVEHGVFNSMFDWIEAQTVANPAQSRIAGPFMMAARLLETHASLEDELLFSALEPRLTAGGAREELLQKTEHKRLEILIKNGLMHAAANPDTALSAIEFARRHFRSEEDILFPLARKILSPGHLEQLGACLLSMRGLANAKPEEPAGMASALRERP